MRINTQMNEIGDPRKESLVLLGIFYFLRFVAPAAVLQYIRIESHYLQRHRDLVNGEALTKVSMGKRTSRQLTDFRGIITWCVIMLGA